MIVLRTFSKIYGLAGLRVGYGIAPEDVVTEIAKVRRAFDVSSAAQAAALASLGDEEELARRRRQCSSSGSASWGSSSDAGFDVAGPAVANSSTQIQAATQCCLRRAVARGRDRAAAECIRVGDGDPGDRRNSRGERVLAAALERVAAAATN